MHLRSLAILLLGSLAVGQATPGPSGKPGTPPSQSATPSKTTKPDTGSTNVPATAPVITINGVCDTSASAAKTKAAGKPGAACKTVITRAQFEELSNALQPNMNAAMKRRLADLYPKMLVMAHEARKRGLENDPKYKQVLQFARLQILSQELSKTLKEEADKVPDSDIQKYYADNTAAFQQADLKRIFVPNSKQSESAEDEAEEAEKPQSTSATTQKPAEQQKSAEQKKADQEAQKKADEEAMKKVADSLHARAAAGEDFDKLQKEAFDAAGVKGTPPSTSIGKLTANEVPVNHRAVLELKPGAVSDIITEPNGYYIYKVVAKDVKPLEQARDQIRATLAQQRMQDAVQKIQDEAKTELNETYFAATPSAPGMPGAGGMAGHGMHAPPANDPANGAPAAPAATPTKSAAEGQTSAPATPKN